MARKSADKKIEKKRKPVKTEKNPKTQIISDVYDTDGKKSGKMTLPVTVFAAKINPDLIAQAVRVYLSNQRAGTHAVKTRAEVT
ncbi:50S ribosomal protein L4, partial [Candidatus Gottesmanbacteria bacterium RBG_13_37_7]